VLQSFGRNLGNALGQFERRRMAHLKRGDEVKLGCLGLDRLDDALLSMSGIDAPEPGHTVENASSVRLDIMHALGRNEQARLCLERPIGRHGQPEGVHRLRGEGRVGRCGMTCGHGGLLLVMICVGAMIGVRA
jgi:hypothetical protein